jgi:hypothetical protein
MRCWLLGHRLVDTWQAVDVNGRLVLVQTVCRRCRQRFTSGSPTADGQWLHVHISDNLVPEPEATA